MDFGIVIGIAAVCACLITALICMAIVSSAGFKALSGSTGGQGVRRKGGLATPVVNMLLGKPEDEKPGEFTPQTIEKQEPKQ